MLKYRCHSIYLHSQAAKKSDEKLITPLIHSKLQNSNHNNQKNEPERYLHRIVYTTYTYIHTHIDYH